MPRDSRFQSDRMLAYPKVGCQNLQCGRCIDVPPSHNTASAIAESPTQGLNDDLAPSSLAVVIGVSVCFRILIRALPQ